MHEYERSMKLRLISGALFVIGVFPLSLALAAHAAPAAESHNWAGYAATPSTSPDHGNYTAVSGSWTVPEVAPSARGSADAAWIGIGGLTSSDLIQAGTRASVLADGSVSYQAWYELYPAPAVAIPLSVHAGDVVSVSLTESSPGTWQLLGTDATTGAVFSTTLAYYSSLSSAEWVEEAPAGGNGALMPLDNFLAATFFNASATEDGKTGSPEALGATKLSLVDQSRTALATPSSLTYAGTSFSVSRD
jgi:hypothetical protein